MEGKFSVNNLIKLKMEKMESKKLLGILGLLVITIALASFASASGPAYIVTANNSEFNTGLPSVTVNITGNCSAYYANFTLNSVVVKSNQLVLNGTNTAITATTSTNAGNYLYNFTFWNSTCYAGANITATNRMEINAQPVISSVRLSPVNAVIKGSAVTFTVNFTDQNSSGTDNVNISICTTNAFTTSCTVSSWCDGGAYNNTNTTSCSYTVPLTSLTGVKSYYAFAMDDNSYASAVNSSVFTITGGSGTTDEGVAPTYIVSPKISIADREIVGIKVPYIILLIVILAVAYFIYRWIK